MSLGQMHTKNEQKLIDQKVAKVREVVRNVAKENVILALHNFDMDVEQTIRAFCEGGSQMALGDWEKSGKSSVKKSNQKKKKGKGVPQQNVPSSALETQNSMNSISSSLSSLNCLNGTNQLKPQKDPIIIIQHRNALTNGAYTPKNETSVPPIKGAVNNNHDENPIYRNGDIYKASNTSTNREFPMQLCDADPEIMLKNCFKEIRNALDIRQQHLFNQIVDCAKIGKTVKFTYENSKIVAVISQLGEVIEQGAPIANGCKLPSRQSEKRPDSSSSHDRSVGEDSGLGQLSPQVKQDNSKMAQVKEDGVVLQSDAFSVDELAELQRSIFEQLKAKGVDPAILASLSASSGGSATHRRRLPQGKTDGTNGGGSNSQQRNVGTGMASPAAGAGGSGGGGPRTRTKKDDGRKGQWPQPDISIMK